MRFKKLAIGFVIALSVAFALEVVSKTPSHNKDIESADEHKTFLSIDRNSNIIR